MRVVIVTVDCGRADHFDGTSGLTPNLDRLRTEGATFTQAFSQSQNTLSSHLTLFSSNYLFQHGVYSNYDVVELPPHALPKRLGERGFACQAYTGAQFLARALGDQIGQTDRRYNHPSHSLWSRSWSWLRRPPHRLSGERSFRSGLRWLASTEAAGDAFLWLHVFDAHMVYSAPRHFLNAEVPTQRSSRPCRESVHERGWFCTEHEAFDRPVPVEHYPARYRAAVRYLDDCLGRFVGELKRRGDWDDTLLVVTSDHGECLGEHGLYCLHQKLYDVTVHVPLWIHFPGGAHAGTVVDALVEHVDVAPTVAAAVGFDEPLYMGRDLGLVATGEAPGRDFVFSEHVDHLMHAVRDTTHLRIQAQAEAPNRHGLEMEEGDFLRNGSAASDPAAGQRLEAAGRALLGSRPEVRRAWKTPAEVDANIAGQLKQLGYL